MRKLISLTLILLCFSIQAMVKTEKEAESNAPQIGIIETQTEAKKINIQQKIWELLGNEGFPSLLFIQRLKYADKSNEEIEKLDIPIEMKESIIALKDSLADKIKSISMDHMHLNEEDRNNIKLLINAGANREKTKEYLAECVMQTLRIKDISQEDKNNVLFLINEGADVNFNPYETALILASSRGFKDIVAELINAKANLNLQAKGGSTALMKTIMYARIGIAELLIDKGADVTTKDALDYTALILAVKFGYYDLARKIIDAFINLNPDNKKALEEFINQEAQGGETALIEAINSNDIEMVKLLIKNGANPNLKNSKGFSALDIARHHRIQHPEIDETQQIIKILEKAEGKQ